MCVLSDHQPANHQEFELSVIKETTVNTGKSKEHCAQGIKSEFKDVRTQRTSPDSKTVMFEGQNEHCAQPIITEFEGARTQRISPDSNTVMFVRENEHCAQPTISEFEGARTQKISSELNIVVIKSEIHAEDTDAEHIVHFEEAQDFSDAGSLITQAPQSQSIHATINLDLSVHGLIINMDALVVDLNCHAILGMDVLGDASKLPFILDLVGDTLSGGGYETILLHRFQAATECFAETTDSVCIPPHSEVMLWAKLKTNNGRRGPTAGVVLALQTFVQEFGLLVGRSLVRADAEDWKIPILIYNSDPCTMQPADCTCNPVIVPAHTRIARVEEIQAIQHIGSRETEIHTEEGALPPHLIDVLDAATELTTNQRARAATFLAKHVQTFPAPGTPITGRTEAVMHDIDTGSTRPIRCNPRKLSPKKIKIQQELVDKMLEEGQIEHSVSAWSAPTVLETKKDGTTRFCVDYRRLNNSTKKDAFPLPRIDDSLNSLSGQ